MKICLFDSIGNLGIVIGWKKPVHDSCLVFEVEREGVLRIGDKAYPVVNGQARVPQYTLVFGERRTIYFADKQGRVYTCGAISRTGSCLINISNDIEACMIALCQKIDEQDLEILELKKQIADLKDQSGITIV